MIKQYCVLLENEQITALLSLIKSHYNYDAKDSLQEVDLVYVTNRVDDTDSVALKIKLSINSLCLYIINSLIFLLVP